MDRILSALELRTFKNQFILNNLLAFLVVIIFSVFLPNLLVFAFYIMLYPYLVLTRNENHLQYLYISSSLSLIWILIAREQYSYNKSMLVLFGLNTFPLFAWASGLFLVYMIYSYFEKMWEMKSFMRKFFFFVALYWPLLISLETIGYHFLNIRNMATSMYAGLPVCDCMHAPLWMQASYLALGPVFFLISSFFTTKKV